MESEPWLPAVYTRPLRDDFVSDGPKLRRFVSLFWRDKDNPSKPFELLPFQAWLIDRILERYPADWPEPAKSGRLRFEQVVVCMARQNSKSVLGAILGLYGIVCHVPGPTVIGLAESVKQANIIYDRAKYVIDSSPQLSQRFKATGTRGITAIGRSGSYNVYPNKPDAINGIPISLCLFDEAHLLSHELYAQVQLGTSARQDGLVVVTTTAGDADSTLLASLIETGREAAEGDPDLERFGLFLWEAPDGADILDPEAIRAANPLITSGIKDLDKTLNAVRGMPEAHARQYVHNRFVQTTGDQWLPSYLWHQLPKGELPGAPSVVSVDRGPSWEWATITVAAKDTGKIFTELVGSLEGPDVARLADACAFLARRHRVTFVCDAYSLGDLAKELRGRGLTVETFTQRQIVEACATAYAQIARGNVVHDHHPVVSDQVGRGVRKNVGDSWRIVRPNQATSIDALMSTVLAIYAAETIPTQGSLIA